MDSTFGLVGQGYAILAADATAARSILVFKHDQEKVRLYAIHYFILFTLIIRFAYLMIKK
jgi:hypothetical protein